MATHRTAMGKVVDMSSIASKNEHTRAVGNMSVNARGDTIDARGNIIQPVTTKVNEAYSKTVGNRSAQVRNREVVATNPLSPANIDLSELNEIELELDSNTEEDMAIEAIKAEEIKTASKTKSRK